MNSVRAAKQFIERLLGTSSLGRDEISDQLTRKIKEGEIDRRDFLQLTSALGVFGMASLASEKAEAVLNLGAFWRKRSRSNSYAVSGSLRFDSSRSTYLARTPSSSGNRKTWTFSAWVKRSKLGVQQTIFESTFASSRAALFFESGDTIRFSSDTGYSGIQTSAVFRDCSAWYHIVCVCDTTQAASSARLSLWVNGVRASLAINSPAPQNSDGAINSTAAHFLGGGASTLGYCELYLADVNFIDGVVQEPTAFAEADATTGQWIPKKYTGSYGANGFYLSFNNATSSSTLGYDSAALSGSHSSANNWALNNHVVADYVLDSPTNNYCTFNALNKHSSVTFANGALQLLQSSSTDVYGGRGTLYASSGKWYVEYKIDASRGSNYPFLGLCNSSYGSNTNFTPSVYYDRSGNLYSVLNSTSYNTGVSGATTGDYIMFAFDIDNNKLWCGKNGTWFSGDPATGTSPSISSAAAFPKEAWTIAAGTYSSRNLTVNCGQGGQDGLTYNAAAGGYFKYAPPSGFKALCSKNLPDPVIKQPYKYFQAILYTGNGNSQQVGVPVKSQTTYQIERSLRFNRADSASLTRTPAASTNKQTTTFSCWLKRTGLDTSATYWLFNSYKSSGNFTYLTFSNGNSGRLQIYSSTGSSDVFNLITNTSFLNPDVWYHIVVTFDLTNATASDRVRVWINGVRETSFATGTFPSTAATSTWFNDNCVHSFGVAPGSSSSYFDGYLAETYLIDGQALSASSFGQFDANGVWIPKAYSGTFGTNGFHLNFSDNTAATATALGKDVSGNANNWTPNNFSVATGIGNDSVFDTPTNYTASGITHGNYATLSPFDKSSGITLRNGNLEIAPTGWWNHVRSTLYVSSGKWYIEQRGNPYGTYMFSGICTADTTLNTDVPNTTGANYCGLYWNPKNFRAVGTDTALSGVNDLYNNATHDVDFAIDLDIMKFWIRVDGTWANGGNPDTNTGGFPIPAQLKGIPVTFFAGTNTASYSPQFNVNFGQLGFERAVPTGFKSISVENLTSTTAMGMPDLVVIKSRDNTTSHYWYDTVRGAGNRLASDSTTSELKISGLTEFNTGGFRVGNETGNNGTGKYVAWTWKKGASPGFDIVSYTGNGGGSQSIAHSLGTTPAFMIVKNRTRSSTGWAVYHSSIDSSAKDYRVDLAANSAKISSSVWNNSAPTTTHFSVGSSTDWNGSGDLIIAYLWAEVPGFSKMGSYKGTGSADGPFVWCGFRPAYVLTKRVDSTSNWYLWDNRRTGSFNGTAGLLYPEVTTAESNYSASGIDLLSNGFKLRNTDSSDNASGGTYIFVAFAEAPFKYARAR